MRPPLLVPRCCLTHFLLFPLTLLCVLPAGSLAHGPPGERSAMSDLQISQEDIATERISPYRLRRIGGLLFSTPFTKLDGFGHGPVSPPEPDVLETRPTLQGNGTFLRLNGLDAQSCMECHSVLSNATVPSRFGVGGVGSGSANVMAKVTWVDPTSEGEENFNGRFINPPFVFGSGGVELLGKEMTLDLQQLKAQARQSPGTRVALVTKGVSFGSISCQQDGTCDTSQVEGVDADLVVRPFGRKGEFATVRAFDVEAMNFHFGMEPVEMVGEGVDRDGDGMVNEVTIGQMSALHIFNTTLTPPIMTLSSEAQDGQELFEHIGCADCHIPSLTTTSPMLTYSFPEVPTDPTANVFYSVDLSDYPTFFEEGEQCDSASPPFAYIKYNCNIVVPLFADLKRHDMGPGLAESFGEELAAQFTTARLWGVADTAPYLHDGRALTLTEAITLHGGEAQAARDAFVNTLDTQEKETLLTFLRSLRTPHADDVAPDLQAENNGRDREH